MGSNPTPATKGPLPWSPQPQPTERKLGCLQAWESVGVAGKLERVSTKGCPNVDLLIAYEVEISFGPVEQFGVFASLSRKRSPVQVRSGSQQSGALDWSMAERNPVVDAGDETHMWNLNRGSQAEPIGESGSTGTT